MVERLTSRLRAARESRGVNQARAAMLSGTGWTRKMISEFERGLYRPNDAGPLVRIFQALGVGLPEGWEELT